jgi:hypothetical protein
VPANVVETRENYPKGVVVGVWVRAIFYLLRRCPRRLDVFRYCGVVGRLAATGDALEDFVVIVIRVLFWREEIRESCVFVEALLFLDLADRDRGGELFTPEDILQASRAELLLSCLLLRHRTFFEQAGAAHYRHSRGSSLPFWAD